MENAPEAVDSKAIASPVDEQVLEELARLVASERGGKQKSERDAWLDIVYDIVAELSRGERERAQPGWVTVDTVASQAGLRHLTPDIATETLQEWVDLEVMLFDSGKKRVRFANQF